jgi:transcription initiation factor TFIIH subunit 4
VGRFYPTRLALNITCAQNSEGPVLEEDTPKGYIIVETNYRVYVYSDSNLQVALIGLFTELMYRYGGCREYEKKKTYRALSDFQIWWWV